MSYLSLPGTSGSYASTPDSAALSITGDIDIRVRVAMVDFTPASESFVIGKYVTAGDQRSWQLVFQAGSTGRLQFYRSTVGTAGTTTNVVSSASTGATDGSLIWVRVTYATASGNVIFYTSSDGVTWSQLGTTQNAGAGAIYDSTSPVTIGDRPPGTAIAAAAQVHSAEVRNGIDGTIVASPDFNKPLSTTSFADAQGNTWTLNGSAVIAGTYGLPIFLNHYRQQGFAA